MVKEFEKSYNIVYIKCHEAAINLDYEITKEEITEGVILFNVGISWSSWGEKFKVAITTVNANLTRVEVASEVAFEAQVIDWGKNNENVKIFFREVNNLLKT